MQLICEAYFVLKHALGLSNDELYDVFDDWNQGELDSYLIEITRDIFSVKDPDTGELPGRHDSRHGRRQGDRQVDEPVGPRPGRAQHAGDRGGLRPLPVGHEGRPRAGQQGAHGPDDKVRRRPQAVHRADCGRRCTPRRFAATPRASCRCEAAAKEHNWPLNFGNIALLWRGGCIIRARFLDRIKEAFDADAEPGKPAAGPVLHRRRSQRPSPPGGTSCATAVETGHSRAGLRHGPGLLRRLPPARGCRPTCCKPSAIISAPTPTSASTSRACSTAIGCGCAKSPSKHVIAATSKSLDVSSRTPQCHRPTNIWNSCSAFRARWPSSSAAPACWAGRCAEGLARAGAAVVVAGSNAERGQAARAEPSQRLGGTADVSAGRRQPPRFDRSAAGRNASVAVRPRRHAGQLRRREFGQRVSRRARRRLATGARRQSARHALGLPDFRPPHGRFRRRRDFEHRQRYGPHARCRGCSPTAPRRRRS